jgi:hypothetical protein
MRVKGINYDTGFVHLGASSRPTLDPDVVEQELRIIRDDLHCTAVRVTGGDQDHLELAASIVARLGLEVWYSPFTANLTRDEMLAFLAEAATRAERIRRQGAEVVFVTGAEISLLNQGFLPGETIAQRLAWLTAPAPDRRAAFAEVPERVNAFLRDAVATVRARFGGKLTYAAVPLDRVDWAPFDIASLDVYRTDEIAGTFEASIRETVAGLDKPVAITEFGCASYLGAAAKGATAGMIVEYEGAVPVRLNGDYVRDETGQAAAIAEHLAAFEAAGVDAAFLFTFAGYGLPHRGGDPRLDLDLASYGIVRLLESGTGETYPGLPWEPKPAFATLAAAYRG